MRVGALRREDERAAVVRECLLLVPEVVEGEAPREVRLARLPRERSGELYRARSPLYRSQILQLNMRLKALAEIYTMHSFAQLCNLKFLSKFC